MTKPELLAPAGSLEKLKVAFHFGADAVYMGGHTFGLRAKAKNFTPSEMAEGIALAHSLGKRAYVTVNIFARNDDFIELEGYLKELDSMCADALIISDPGVFVHARKTLPNMELHVSTQANAVNFAAVRFWKELGASRVILGRELSLREIKEIHEHVPDIQLEAFVHGSMCMAYSGRCLISNYMSNRDANRGECNQPCRFTYYLVEKQSGEEIRITEEDGGAYIMSSKDLCMISHIPELLDAGITGFKIEGRMKTAYYVAAVTKVYKAAVDCYLQNPEKYRMSLDYYANELMKVSHRQYTTGFYFGKMTGADHSYDSELYANNQDFLGIIESYEPEQGIAHVEQRNKFSVGDEIEIFTGKGENIPHTIRAIQDENGNEIQSAPHPQQKIKLKIDMPVKKHDILRRTTK